MFRASKVDCVSCEEQARFVNERLTDTEEKLTKLYNSFSNYIHKSSSLRDATDDIALTLYEIASSEKINQSTKKQVIFFSELLATLNDYRENKIQHLRANLAAHLSHYNTICRNVKEEVKTIFSAKEKETNKRKQLGKLRNLTPFNRERIVKVEAALASEISNVSRAQKELEEHATFLEKKKLEDIKGMLEEYVVLELEEHVIAIELLTQSFNKLKAIDISSDLKEFEEILKTNPISLKLLEEKYISTKEQDPVIKEPRADHGESIRQELQPQESQSDDPESSSYDSTSEVTETERNTLNQSRSN